MSSPHPDYGSGLALGPGFRIGEYAVERVLGKGGFGITYLARDTGLNSQVAIKELLPDGIATRDSRSTVVPHDLHEQDFDWARRRFMEEARLLARLNHPHIVRVLRLLEANGTACMVMEYVTGSSLMEWMRSHPNPTEQEVLQILLPLLHGLEYVHSLNLLHRDISPENIILRPNGMPVLLDFGSARVQGEKTVAMTSVIRHGYSPFEQYQTNGRQGPATDIYALASVMVHWLTGEKPSSSPDRMAVDEPAGELEKKLGRKVSIPFIRALERGRALRYADRPQSVAEWRQMFPAQAHPSERHPSQSRREPMPVTLLHQPGRQMSGRPPSQQQPPSTPVYTPVPDRRSPALLISGVILALLAAAACMAWLLLGGTPGQEFFDEGERHWHHGDYTEAAASFQKAVEKNPTYAAAWWRRGQALFEGNVKESAFVDAEAVSCMEKASELDPKLAGPLISRARVLIMRKQRDIDRNKAKELLDQARLLDASSYEGKLLLCLVTKGEEVRNAANAALARLETSALEKQASAQLWLERARSCNFAGEKSQAMEAVNKALAINPSFARALTYRGVLHYQSNDHPSARTDFAASLRLRPDMVITYDMRVDMALDEEDYTSAASDLEQMISLNSGRGQSYLKRGRLKQLQGNLPGAREDYSMCIMKLPELAEAYDKRAGAYFSEKMWGPAINDYTMAIQHGGDTGVRYADRGSARGNNGQYDGAVEDCTRALALDSTLGYTYTVRAVYLIALKRYEEALVDCETAEEKIDLVAEHLHKQMRETHARVLRLLNRISEAEKIEALIPADSN